MAKTALQAVNDVLKKTESLDSDGELTSFSDSARQLWIDNALSAINETIDRLFLLPQTPARPNQISENTITLVTNDQDYALQTNLVRLLDEFALIDQTNNHIIAIDASQDAYRKMIMGDLDQDDTGLPSIACIRPTDGQLWLDRKPTANENGRIYKYRYEKELSLSAISDTVPFTDPVYRGVILAATELYKRINHRDFDPGFFNAALAQAAARLSRLPRRQSWDQTVTENVTDPFTA